MSTPSATRSTIDALVRCTGAPDEYAAIRLKAAEAIERYRAAFGDPTMPLDIRAIASLLGIGWSNDAPVHSEDAELVPHENGRVSIRVNPDRPETRTRFSVGHEVSHTFFPDYQAKTWCRTDARYRRRDNPDDLLEMLCDVGAAELILPTPWFVQDASAVSTADGLLELARKYATSREATLRRFAETHDASVAAVFFSWKLKPTQQRRIGRDDQFALFDTDPAESARRAKRLRLDYTIPSAEFAKAGHYLPTDKSVENAGPLYEAAVTGCPRGGECFLDLGQSAGVYRVLAVPLWTNDEGMGPAGENGVGAIITPLDGKGSTRRSLQQVARLFE